MREISPQKLWIGNYGDASNIQQIMDAGVMAVVDLAYEELPPKLPRNLVYCCFPILDGQQNSRRILVMAIGTLAALMKKGVPTLTYCSAGMSRTPAIVAAALTLVDGGVLEENLRKVVASHPHDISPQLWREVKEVCETMTT